MDLRLGYLSYAAPPASGGASLYMDYLFSCMAADDRVARFALFTEKLAKGQVEPLRSDGGSTVHRVFSRRATLQTRGWEALPRLCLQQLQFARLLKVARDEQLDAVFFHSYTIQHAPLIRPLLAMLRRAGVRPVLDVRDLSVRATQSGLVSMFDAVIACGRGPEQQLLDHFGAGLDPVHIPVPFQSAPDDEIDRSGSAKILADLGLSEGATFVLVSGGVTPTKFPPEAVATVRELWERHGIAAVACGIQRGVVPGVDELLRSGALRYAGIVSHRTYLGIMDSASCVASMSSSEGLPRTMLEAMAMRKPVFMPDFVPEFEGLPSLSGGPEERAHDIAEACAVASVVSDYDLEAHDPAAVAGAMVDLVERIA